MPPIHKFQQSQFLFHINTTLANSSLVMYHTPQTWAMTAVGEGRESDTMEGSLALVLDEHTVRRVHGNGVTTLMQNQLVTWQQYLRLFHGIDKNPYLKPLLFGIFDHYQNHNCSPQSP